MSSRLKYQGVNMFTVHITQTRSWATVFSWCEGIRHELAVMKGSPLWICWWQPTTGGTKENSHTRIFWSVLAWGLPTWPDHRNCFKGVTLPEITDNQKPNSNTTPLQLPWPPLYAMKTKTGVHSFRGLLVDCIAPPVSGNTLQQQSQTNVYATIRVSMLPEPLVGHYVGVHDYGPGSTPRPAYTSSEMRPPNLHFWVLCRHTQVEVIPKLQNSTTEIGKMPGGETGV
jgi:hypothetical protein